MSRAARNQVFLQRANYRQRRLRDAARLVVVLGIVLWLYPLAWPDQHDPETGQSGALLYVFGVWLVLVVLSAALSKRILGLSNDASSEETDA